MQNSKAKMKKHIVIAKLFDTGGSNAHLKLLVKYFGADNVILILENEHQKLYLDHIFPDHSLKTKVIKKLHGYAHLRYRFTTNIKECLQIIGSILTILLLSAKYKFADVTISSVESEKYLYLLWLPFVKTTYILHTEPTKFYTPFTPFTCNSRLSSKKQLVAVSHYMKKAICQQWDINYSKQSFVMVIHNSLPEDWAISPPLPYHHNKQKIILTIGRVDANKNPKIWLQVARNITAKYLDVSFIWLGNGPGLDDFTQQTAAGDNITFVGLVTDPLPYLKKAYLYYQPSLNESHGIAVLEAMYNGLPCVVSNAGGLPESVNNNDNGSLVDSLNVQEHVLKISQLLNNTGQRDLYGQNSSKRYQEVFSYNAFKIKMDAIYA